MQNNLGYFFYKSLYNITNVGLEINDNNKKQLLDRALFDNEKEYSLQNLDIIKLCTTYPGLTTGVGMPHGIKEQNEDFKIGFYFDHTTGLPLIPGSSVKGALRAAFPDISKKEHNGNLQFVFKNKTDEVKAKWIQSLLNNIDTPEFFNKHYEPLEIISPNEIENIYSLVMSIFEGIKDHTKSYPQERFYSIYNRDIFYDAIITNPGKEGKIVVTDSITPHIKDGLSYQQSMLKNPNPLLFLKVLPNVEFTFHFSLTENRLSKEHKIKLFKYLLLTLGIGAKTNVGYGQFIDPESDKYKKSNQGSSKKEDKTKPGNDQEISGFKIKLSDLNQIPSNEAKLLIPNSDWDGILILQQAGYNYYLVDINKNKYLIRKKTEKNPDLNCTDKVKIHFQKEFKKDNPEFKVFPDDGK